MGCRFTCREHSRTYPDMCPVPRGIHLTMLLFGTSFIVTLEYHLGNSKMVESVKNTAFWEPSCTVGGMQTGGAT